MSFLRSAGQKVSVGLLCTLLFVGSATAAHADTSAVQAAQIQSLLVLLDQLRAQLLLLQGGNTSVTTASCTQITHLLTIGSTDATTGGGVTKLQKFLTQKGYYTYGSVTGYFGQATLDAVKRWQDTEKFYEAYGTPAGRGVIGERSRAEMAELCNFVTIDQRSVTSSSNLLSTLSSSFTLSGTAKNAQAIFVALVPEYQTGTTDWASAYRDGDAVAFTGDIVTKVVNGKWSVKFTGVRSGSYEARVYDNSNSAEQKLLLTQPLTVSAPDTIDFSLTSGPKTITLGVGQKATDGGISISVSDVFLTNGRSGSSRASFVIEPQGFNASSYSAGMGEYVPEGGGGFSDSKAPNKTIKIKVTDMSQSMNTVTLTVEDPGPKG